MCCYGGDTVVNDRIYRILRFSRQAVTIMRDAFGGRETTSKMEADNRRELHSRQSVEANAEAQRQNTYTMANRDYMNDQAQQQSTIRREQDQSLDKMSSSLDRLGQMAREIDTELKDQDKIIEDIDRNVDDVQGRMDSAIKGVEKLLKTKNRCQLATIAILVLILVISECARCGAVSSSFCQLTEYYPPRNVCC